MSLDRVLYSLIAGSSFVKGQWCITVSLERLVIMYIVYWYLWYKLSIYLQFLELAEKMCTTQHQCLFTQKELGNKKSSFLTTEPHALPFRYWRPNPAVIFSAHKALLEAKGSEGERGGFVCTGRGRW